MTRRDLPPGGSSGTRAHRAWYEFVRYLLWLIFLVCYRVRCGGRKNIPATGGVLILANHQSLLDPPLFGMVVPREVNYVARDTLFDNKLLGAFIRSVNAIPIDRDGLGLAGLKETLRRLKRGEIVILFPEGTRTPNGEIQPLKPGFSALVKRTGACILPMAVDGSYQAWPRKQPLPLPNLIQIEVGPPITNEAAAALDERELITLVDQRIRDCFAQARNKRKRRLWR